MLTYAGLLRGLTACAAHPVLVVSMADMQQRGVLDFTTTLLQRLKHAGVCGLTMPSAELLQAQVTDHMAQRSPRGLEPRSDGPQADATLTAAQVRLQGSRMHEMRMVPCLQACFRALELRSEIYAVRSRAVGSIAQCEPVPNHCTTSGRSMLTPGRALRRRACTRLCKRRLCSSLRMPLDTACWGRMCWICTASTRRATS